MLKTNCILTYKRKHPDEIIYSIMSKHTLNDGITPNPRIKDNAYDLWRPELSPPLKLLGDYYKRDKSWNDFEQEYKTYLRNQEMREILEELANYAENRDITLLCIEEFTPNNFTSEGLLKCHRRIVAEQCLIYRPNMIADIK